MDINKCERNKLYSVYTCILHDLILYFAPGTGQTDQFCILTVCEVDLSTWLDHLEERFSYY